MLNGARVCYEHQKGYFGWERGQGWLSLLQRIRCKCNDEKVASNENVTGNNRFAYRSYDTYLTGMKQQGDQRYMARYHAHADQMMAEKCDGFINSNLSLDRRGPAAGATINPLRSLGCGLT